MSRQAGRKELENRIKELQNEVHILREKNSILGASHAMLSTIYNAIPGMISVVDRDFNILDMSDRFSETIPRRKREEVIGLKCYKVNKGRDSVCPECLVIKAFESGEIQTGITIPEREATTGMRFKTVAAPIRDERGEITGAIECIIDITDLKHIEEDLKKEKVFTDNILNTLTDVFSVFDTEGNFIRWNRAVREVTGYQDDEISSMRPTDFFHEKDRKRVENGIMTAVREGKASLEMSLVTKEGKEIPYEFTGNLLKDSEGKPFSICVVGRDITERKVAEEALKASEEKYRSIIDNASDMIFENDVMGNFTYANPGALKKMGYSAEEVIGRDYLKFIHRDCREDAKRHFETQFAQRIPNTYYEVPVITKKGEKIWLEQNVRLMMSGGKARGFQTIARDISERKRAEEALRQSEERYRSLVENTMDGYFICDIPSGRFRFLNQRSCDLNGFTMQEGLELRVWDVISPGDHGQIRKRIQERLEGKTPGPERLLCTGVRKDGSTFRAEVSTSLVTFQGRPAVQGVLRDITEQDRLQKQLQQAHRMEAIGTLAGGIAHDFNNMLMGIQGNASLMLLDLDTRHPHHEKLKNIEHYVKNGADLSRQLLGFARGGKYQVKSTDPNDLVLKSAEMFGRTKKEIRIHKKLDHDIRPVEVDRGQIEQVLLNLFVNAWQAMPGGGDLYLHTENVMLREDFATPYAQEAGRYVKISITDTGIGMDQVTRQRIFDPFFTTKEMGRGTGLGLASAYGIIKNHGGIIEASSEKGKGSTFSIYLPASEKGVIEQDKRDNEIVKGRGTVLLVDDEQMIIDVGRQMLEKIGYKVLTAEGGVKAVEVYEKTPEEIHLVILDMIMPDMGGDRTYDRLRQIDPNVKVLLSSGYSIDGKAGEILSRGCNGFIQKPFKLDELSKKIRDILGTESF